MGGELIRAHILTSCQAHVQNDEHWLKSHLQEKPAPQSKKDSTASLTVVEINEQNSQPTNQTDRDRKTERQTERPTETDREADRDRDREAERYCCC